MHSTADSFMKNGAPFVWFTGVVEDIIDPLQMGRVRVRCFGFHTDNKDLIPTASLPWAVVMTPITSGSISGIGRSATGILPGSWVVGFFRDGSSAQDPVVLGSIPSQTIGRPTSVGFTDPSGINPRNPGAIDTPVPATNQYRSSQGYITKIDTRQTKVETAIPPKMPTVSIPGADSYYTRNTWDSWDVTKTVTPLYPKNHVWETESGHILEVDDTPGYERISVLHKSGTYHEIRANGDQTLSVRGDRYTVIFGTDNIYVKGAVNLTIDGDLRTLVKGNYHLEVEGNMTEYIKGSLQTKVGNSVQSEISQEVATNITENFKMRVGGNRDILVTGDNNENYGATHSHTTTADSSITVMGDAINFTLGSISFGGGSTLAIITGDEMNIQTPGAVTLTASGLIKVTSDSNNIRMEANRIDLNP